MIFVIAILTLSVAAVIGTVVALSSDGYRALPTDALRSAVASRSDDVRGR